MTHLEAACECEFFYSLINLYTQENVGVNSLNQDPNIGLLTLKMVEIYVKLIRIESNPILVPNRIEKSKTSLHYAIFFTQSIRSDSFYSTPKSQLVRVGIWHVLAIF